jgi:hypothetical protein
VEVEDMVYEATSIVPSAANLKEITQSDFPSGPFGDEGAIYYLPSGMIPQVQKIFIAFALILMVSFKPIVTRY